MSRKGVLTREIVARPPTWLLAVTIPVSAGVFAAAIIVHLSTFTDLGLMHRFPAVMYLHLAIFPPFIVAVWAGNEAQRRAVAEKKRLEPDETEDDGEERPKRKEEGPNNMFPFGAPKWCTGLAGLFGTYALVNFLIFMIWIPATPVRGREGDTVFRAKKSGGTVEVTEKEYREMQNWELRGFSGHWMIFSLVPVLSSACLLANDLSRRRGWVDNANDGDADG